MKSNGTFHITCHCSMCRRRRVSRLVAGAAWYLQAHRDVLDRIQHKPAHVASWRIKSDGGYAAREANDQWGAL